MTAAKLLAACVCVVGFAPPAKHVRGPTQQYSTIQYPKNPLESVLSLGAPRFQPPNGTYVTAGGVGVTRQSYTVEDAHGATQGEPGWQGEPGGWPSSAGACSARWHTAAWKEGRQ